MAPYSMFGTIRLNPDHRTSDFVKSADGDLYGQLGGKLPRHRACDRCRAKKTKCSGEEQGCRQCKEQATQCVYSASSNSGVKGAGRRRRAEPDGGKQKLGGSRSSAAATTTKRPRLGKPVRRDMEPPAAQGVSPARPVPGWPSFLTAGHDMTLRKTEDVDDGKLLKTSGSYKIVGGSGSSDVDVASNSSEQRLETPESPSNILDLSDFDPSRLSDLTADDYATTPSIPESGPSPSSDYSAFFDLADLAATDGPHGNHSGFYDDLCPSLSFDPTAHWGEDPDKPEWGAVKTPAALLLHLVPGLAPPTCPSCTSTHSSYSSLFSTDMMDDMDDFMLAHDDSAPPSSYFSPMLSDTDTAATTPPGWELETGTTTPDSREPLTPPYSVAATAAAAIADGAAVCTCASSAVAWDLLNELDRRI